MYGALILQFNNNELVSEKYYYDSMQIKKRPEKIEEKTETIKIVRMHARCLRQAS